MCVCVCVAVWHVKQLRLLCLLPRKWQKGERNKRSAAHAQFHIRIATTMTAEQSSAAQSSRVLPVACQCWLANNCFILRQMKSNFDAAIMCARRALLCSSSSSSSKFVASVFCFAYDKNVGSKCQRLHRTRVQAKFDLPLHTIDTITNSALPSTVIIGIPHSIPPIWLYLRNN